MEPARTKDVAGREHDHECDQIEGRLVGEESIRLDSEIEPVNQERSFLVESSEMPYPSIVATALRNRASASASELIMLKVCERICVTCGESVY